MNEELTEEWVTYRARILVANVPDSVGNVYTPRELERLADLIPHKFTYNPENESLYCDIEAPLGTYPDEFIVQEVSDDPNGAN